MLHVRDLTSYCIDWHALLFHGPDQVADVAVVQLSLHAFKIIIIGAFTYCDACHQQLIKLLALQQPVDLTKPKHESCCPGF